MKNCKHFLASLLLLAFLFSVFSFSAFADKAAVEDATEIASADEEKVEKKTEEEIPDPDELKKLAKDGDADAQFLLGAYYLEDEEPDYIEAMRWLRKAGEQKHCEAMVLMALLYANGLGVARDKEQAMDLLKEAIELGSSDAMVVMGDLYLNGHFTVGDSDGRSNAEVACEWYEKAADQDDIGAMLKLCYLYYDSFKVERDYEKVMTYAKKAAELGSTDGMVYVGTLYMEGKGVEADGLEAMDWFLEAADEGDTTAMIQLGVLYEQGKAGIKPDYEKAVDWYTQAADLEDVDAMLKLCNFYRYEYKGNDIEKAEYWAEEAAKLGNGEGYNSLGSDAEYDGDGEAAVRYYEKAADAGDRYAMRCLSKLYEQGELVEKNPTKAKEWQKKYDESSN